MFIHIGTNIIISDKKLIGIFNRETLLLSTDNAWLLQKIGTNDKTITIDIKNNILSSTVSPYTVIKRTELDEDFVWRRNNDKKL